MQGQWGSAPQGAVSTRQPGLCGPIAGHRSTSCSSQVVEIPCFSVRLLSFIADISAAGEAAALFFLVGVFWSANGRDAAAALGAAREGQRGK